MYSFFKTLNFDFSFSIYSFKSSTISINSSYEGALSSMDSDEEYSDSDSDSSDEESSKKRGLVGIAIKEASSIFASPTCLMAKGDKVKSIDDNVPSYDELMDMVEDLNEYVGKEKSKFKVLKKEYISLKDSYEELKEAHDSLLLKDIEKSHSHVGITCNLMNEMPRVEIASNAISMSSTSTSCDDLLFMPCCSKDDSITNMANTCDPLLIVENHELKEQVTKLSKSLERCFKGKATLDKLLSEQRCSFNKEDLGMCPRKVRNR